MLNSKTLHHLKDKKNLLAFSAGGDSTALFFLLQDSDIDFDIAIVNYGIREQSKDEVAYAKNLSTTYNKKCHVFNADIIEKNFEASAREIRYDFFEELIKEFHYDNLLTAHHLGDRFEWMLMQFCKGAGCVEIAGMQIIEKRENYQLIRPVLECEKNELLEYLNSKKINYFEDETNLDKTIKRNSFRHNYSNPLLEKYKDGIRKSFNYIDIDREDLISEIEVNSINKFAYFKSSNNKRSDIYTIDKYLKSCGYLASKHERELLKTEKTVILGRKFVVNQDKKYVFIIPYLHKDIGIMDKEFKEKMRILKIEPKLRTYLNKDREAYNKIIELST